MRRKCTLLFDRSFYNFLVCPNAIVNRNDPRLTKIRNFQRVILKKCDTKIHFIAEIKKIVFVAVKKYVKI